VAPRSSEEGIPRDRIGERAAGVVCSPRSWVRARVPLRRSSCSPGREAPAGSRTRRCVTRAVHPSGDRALSRGASRPERMPVCRRRDSGYAFRAAPALGREDSGHRSRGAGDPDPVLGSRTRRFARASAAYASECRILDPLSRPRSCLYTHAGRGLHRRPAPGRGP
jgi:hypothetical protein